jgi:predicted TPR repeat methyltransferase
LNPGDCFIFSAEALEGPEGGAPIRLQEHGRYAHSLDYLQFALGKSAFGAQIARQEMLRFERGAPVQGWIVLARRLEQRAGA